VVRLTFGAIQARMPDKEDKMRAQLKWVVGLNTFEICVTNADGTHLVQRTDNALFEGTRDVVSRWAESRIPEPGGANPTLLCNVVTALGGSWSFVVDESSLCDRVTPPVSV